MPRYNRDDYSACDWRQTKSDLLRAERANQPSKRRITLAHVFGVMASIAAATFIGLSLLKHFS